MKLKAADRKFFKEKLLQLRCELLDEVGRITTDVIKKSTKESTGDLSGYSLHMADQASDNFDREFSLDLAQNVQDVLQRIDEALHRIEEKIFGVCIECDKSIPKQRLKIMPYVEMCIPCQEVAEKKVGK